MRRYILLVLLVLLGIPSFGAEDGKVINVRTDNSSLIICVDKDGFLFLTDSGKEIAVKIYERHTVLTKLLTRLGVSPEVAAQDACKMEHAISDASFAAIKRHVQDLL